jgi:tetratricopeptide (TPR) repeat protein
MAMELEAFEEAAQYLDRMQRHPAGGPARAKLLIELGALRRDRLNDPRGAQHAFEEALALDADSEHAGVPVAEAYFGEGRLDEAAAILARLAGTTRRPDAQARILTLQARVASARGEHNTALDAYKRAVRLGDKRAEVLDALAESAIAAGHPVEALSAQKSLLSTLPPESDAMAVALIRLGEIKLSLGDLRGASQDFEQALALDPGSRRATESVVQIAEGLKAWEHLELWERRLLELVDDRDERRAILRRSADRWANEVKDLRRAIQSLSGLLELDPTDRGVLHELLAHRQALHDFRGVANTIEFIVALDPDRARRAKYLQAAATVCRDELHDEVRSIALLERALDEDPTALEAFRSIDAALTRAKDFPRLERAYRKMILRARPLGDADLEFTLWHALGLIYRDRLGQPDAAVEAFRMATQLRPDDARERQIVAELYESVDRSDLAMAELRAAIDRDPLAVEHHRALHALHLRRRDRERAFITASTLVVRGGADEDARNLCESERPRGIPSYGARLLPGYFRQLLAHEDLDSGVSAIFNAVARAARVAKARGTSLPRGSLPPRQREDADAPSHVASAAFFRVAQVLGLTPPTLHLRHDLPGAFATIALEEPTSVLGSSLLEGWGERELTFLAGKHLASTEGEHSVRAHFPAKTELRAILLAAVSLGLGTPSEAEDITRIARALAANLTADEGHVLKGIVGRFAESSGRADVDRWMQCSELTSLRTGLLACGDLITTVQLLRMETGVAGDLAPQDKIRDLVRFAVSERHFELRRMIEIDLREPISYVTRATTACA